MNRIRIFNSQPKKIEFNRSTIVLIGLAILLLSSPEFNHAAAQDVGPAEKIISDTIYVSPPTGEREIDRVSILAALEKVKPGGIIQFAPGTYLIGGEIFRITVPEISLIGHSDGTILLGCNPDEFSMKNPTEFGNNCNGLELAAGRQIVRDLTFKHFFWALHVGCCWDGSQGMMPGEGGQLIEDNIFRSNSNAVRIHGYWSEPTVIRNNRFVNNWHSATVYGNTAHILNNIISAPEPEEVQLLGFPGDGIHLGPPMNLRERVQGVMRSCNNNVVAGNFIDGVTEGIMMSADDPNIICRNNVIRNNTIIIRRAHPPGMPEFISVHDDTDSTVVGVPLALRGPIEDNLIEENIIRGAEGLAVEIRGASNNRIINNTITDVERRKPFPGNAIVALPIIGGDPEAWRQANGSGIWLSPGSNGNEIADNTFEDIASYAVYVEGNNNRVEMRKAGDIVRDMGSDNHLVEKDENKSSFTRAIAEPDTTLPAQEHFDIIISNINLIDGTGAEMQNNVHIYIKDGLIQNILKVKKIGATAEKLIDGEGKYVIPGLFDAHFHFLNYRSRDIENYKDQAKLLTHFGITNILVTNGIIEDLQEFSHVVRKNNTIAPRIFYTSRISTIPGSHPAKGEDVKLFEDGLNINYVRDTSDIKRIVRETKEEGAIAVKIVIEDGPTPPMTERMTEQFIEKFSHEADNSELLVFAHVSDMTEVKMAVQNGVDALVHGAIVDWEKDEQIIREMSEKNISWMFTNMIAKALFFYPLNPEWLENENYKVFDEKYLEPLQDPDGAKAEMSLLMIRQLTGVDSIPSFHTFFKHAMSNSNKILNQGVNIVLGTDTGGPSPYILPGISVHEEMEMLQISGIDPLDIIKISTLNAAKMIGKFGSLGSVEKDKVADLILLHKNPLVDITNTLSIIEVIKDGVIQERIKNN